MARLGALLGGYPPQMLLIDAAAVVWPPNHREAIHCPRPGTCSWTRPPRWQGALPCLLLPRYVMQAIRCSNFQTPAICTTARSSATRSGAKSCSVRINHLPAVTPMLLNQALQRICIRFGAIRVAAVLTRPAGLGLCSEAASSPPATSWECCCPSCCCCAPFCSHFLGLGSKRAVRLAHHVGAETGAGQRPVRACLHEHE